MVDMDSSGEAINYLNVEYLFNQIVEFIQAIIGWITGPHDFTFGWFFMLLKILAAILVVLFIGVILYSILGIKKMREEEHHEIHETVHSAHHEEHVSKNPRWQVVEDHINSSNPAEWKMAIIEADLILEEMLDRAGYDGDTLGDKLRSAEKGDFKTLGYAREAHGVRNQIAHQGSEFAISQTKARRTIDQYKDVFTEFDYI